MLLAIEQKVSNGIRVLNERFGGTSWINKINLEKLDMNRANLCILGQIDNSYWTSPTKLENNYEENLNNGFIGVGHNDNEPLVAEWTRQINLIKNPPKEKEKAMISIEVKEGKNVRTISYETMKKMPGIYTCVDVDGIYIYVTINEAFYIKPSQSRFEVLSEAWNHREFLPFSGEISINLKS